MATAKLLSAVVTIACLLTSCAGKAVEETPSTSALSDKAVGDPCVRADGWTEAAVVPDARETDRRAAQAGGADLVATAVPKGFAQEKDLPPGVKFCIGPDKFSYPNGYVTSNCKTDEDCPEGSSCDGERCRVLCEDDAECDAPLRCAPPGGHTLIRYCACLDCPNHLF